MERARDGTRGTRSRGQVKIVRCSDALARGRQDRLCARRQSARSVSLPRSARLRRSDATRDAPRRRPRSSSAATCRLSASGRCTAPISTASSKCRPSPSPTPASRPSSCPSTWATCFVHRPRRRACSIPCRLRQRQYPVVTGLREGADPAPRWNSPEHGPMHHDGSQRHEYACKHHVAQEMRALRHPHETRRKAAQRAGDQQDGRPLRHQQAQLRRTA